MSAALLCLTLALSTPAPADAQTPDPTATSVPSTSTPEQGAPADTPTPHPTDQTGSDVRVTSMVVSASGSVSSDTALVGENVTVLATVTNFTDSEKQMNLELTANDVLVDSQTITIAPRDARQVQLTYTPPNAGEVTLSLGGLSERISVSEGGPTRIPVGPTVRLRPNRTVVTQTQDAIIDMFWDNSILNTKPYVLEVTVDVPIGLYLYSADGAMGCGAGTCKGLFDIPPSSVRNLPLIVKADEVGNKFIHMNGRYFPQDNPDMWNPISLTVPINVEAKSDETGPPTPVPTAEGGGGGITICNRSASAANPMGGVGELAIGGLLLGSLWFRSRRKRK